MEFIIIAIVIIICIIILRILFSYNKTKLKDIAKNNYLDELANNYPDNIEIAKDCLKKLKNENVKIEKNKDAESSLYIAITNKILIANVRNSYTRIQTIAHECLHSIQDRKLLLFNFIFSNIYLIYFLVISILAIFGILPYKSMFLTILALFAIVYYMVRMYLENDAMIKAKFLAKEYMEDKKILKQDEINKIVDEYDRINNVGIKATNYGMFLNIIIYILIFDLICIFK